MVQGLIPSTPVYSTPHTYRELGLPLQVAEAVALHGIAEVMDKTLFKEGRN